MYPFMGVLVCLLVLYGFIILARKLKQFKQKQGEREQENKKTVSPLPAAGSPSVRMVLLVRDAEEQVEFIIRNAVKHDIASKVLSDNALVVIDMNSSDNTRILLEKLQRDFSNVEVLKYEDRARAFENLDVCPPDQQI